MIGSLPDNLRRALNKFRTDREYGELVRTSFFALLVRISGTLTGFFVTLITSRYFGADALGVVSICLAILSFSSVFGKLGLDVALLKYIAGFSRNNNFSGIKGVYLEAMKIILPATILISSLLYFLAPWMADALFHKPYLTHLLHINAWLALPLVLLLINSECIRGLKKISTYTFLQTGSVSFFALSMLIAASFFLSGKEIPAKIQFISISLAGLLSTWLWLKYSRFNDQKATGDISTALLIRTSSSMFTTTLMQLIMSWSGTLVLAAYVSESDIGIYNALVRISVFTNITILAINSLAMPRFAESFAAKNLEAMKRHADEAARLIFLTSLPLFIILAAWPQWILSIFGKEFPGNENALYILLAGQLIVCFCGLPSQILNMAGRQHVLRNIAVISAIVNVVCCLMMIPRWGILGACYAQLAGTFTWNLLSTLSVKKHFGFVVFFKLNMKGS
jgi:O-antigen/teichoic acid export membrane protein